MKNNEHLTTQTKNINKYKTQRNTKHARNGNDKHQLIQNTHKYKTQTNNNHKRQQQHKQQLHKSTGPCFCLYLWSHSPASEHMSHESQLNHEVFTAVAESYSRCNRPRATPDPEYGLARKLEPCLYLWSHSPASKHMSHELCSFPLASNPGQIKGRQLCACHAHLSQP